MRIAIMILVHKNQEQAQKLVDHLSKSFDVFAHIDKRSKIKIQSAKNVFVYKKYKSYHGSFNLTLASLFLKGKLFPRFLDYDFYGGSQWTNYTHKCVEKMFDYLEQNKEFVKRFRQTHCSDEIFFQTLISWGLIPRPLGRLKLGVWGICSPTITKL